ncbi:MAG: type II toxin-antitoxin system prevent-host-death family antitoxin [Caldilineaceae bacterium]|nr:type II toxin-antitoxin system prevent-host-death family antitoxin [Caldilineaceae bacterium]
MKIASVADVKARFSAYLKESEAGPVVITKNGRPTAVLLNIDNDDEIEGLLLAYSPKFRALLAAARQEIVKTGGIAHDEFWSQLDTEYDAATDDSKPPISDA